MLHRRVGRRAWFGLLALAVTGMGGKAWAAGAAKIAKQQAGYQDHPGGPNMQCSRCANYIAASSTCRVVAGTVSPHGYCGYFTPRS